jgi:hypothetical protein
MLGRWLDMELVVVVVVVVEVEEDEEELNCFFVFLSPLAASSDMSKSDMTEASDSVNDP